MILGQQDLVTPVMLQAGNLDGSANPKLAICVYAEIFSYNCNTCVLHSSIG